ncbi:MAG: NAD(P)/FAD-dependent oxidoreductase [Paracoccaceae bacterium]
MAEAVTEARAIVLGAGAAGLYAAARCGPGVVVVDHAKRPGEKIRISGGGRCNFTNLAAAPERFLSENPHFAKSALARETPWDFLAQVEAAGIGWVEKAAGQLFCAGKGQAGRIVGMLTDACAAAGAEVRLGTRVVEVAQDGAFAVTVEAEGRREVLRAPSLIVATGGKPIPKMGATDLALRLAGQFGLRVTPTRAGLVPFTFPGGYRDLAGVAVPARVATEAGPPFEEAVLFTHRGLSGPAVLQASSYWAQGEAVEMTLAPETDWEAALREARGAEPRRTLGTVAAATLPARAVEAFLGPLAARRMADLSNADIARAAAALTVTLRPAGTEGWRTAEVMVGGVDTRDLDARTMAARGVPGLHFIGECVDVTGWLGGYNFQWAWSSAAAAGAAIAAR